MAATLYTVDTWLVLGMYGMQHTKGRLGEVLKKKWKNKVMLGQYITVRQLIREEDTFLWLSKGDLKAETESEIVVSTRPSVKHEVQRH